MPGDISGLPSWLQIMLTAILGLLVMGGYVFQYLRERKTSDGRPELTSIGVALNDTHALNGIAEQIEELGRRHGRDGEARVDSEKDLIDAIHAHRRAIEDLTAAIRFSDIFARAAAAAHHRRRDP